MAIIYPQAIQGTVTAPASKSMMQRACAASLLRGGKVVLKNYGRSDDDQAALRIIKGLGARLSYLDQDNIQISSNGIADLLSAEPQSIECGESGLSMRLFTTLVSLSDKPYCVLGAGSLRERPVGFFEEVLPKLGVKIKTTAGRLPIQVQGKLIPRTIRVDGALSSQFLTGLLFAYSAAKARDVHIYVDHLKSKPYIDLSLQVLADFGLPVPQHENYTDFYFTGLVEKEITQTLKYVVEGDWSSAAFLLVAGAIAGSVRVLGLDAFSRQADKSILSALQDCGCNLSIQPDQIEVGASANLQAFHFNATDSPDLFPPLAVLAACCQGTSVIEGVHRLVYKESNRALTLQEELGKMGVQIQIQDNLMMITGGHIRSATVRAHQDHRIAMACAIAALKADDPVLIEEAMAVNKSYPNFFNDLQTLQCQ